MSELPKFVTSRLRGGRLAGEHPDADLLTAFAENSLGDRDRSQVLAHLASCSDCCEVIALSTPLEPVPALTSAAAAKEFPRGWFRWPVLRWGAAAACVIVVSAAVLFNMRTAKKNAPIGAYSDSVDLESDRMTASAPAQQTALNDEFKDESGQRSNNIPARATSRPDSAPVAAKRKPAFRAEQPADENELSADTRRRVGDFAYNSLGKSQDSDSQALREKVEESSFAQGIAKEGAIAAQEKKVAPPSFASEGGKDQTGVLVADKVGSQARAAATPAAVVAGQTSGFGVAPAAATKRDDGDVRAVGTSSETVEVTGGAAQPAPIPLEKQLRSFKRSGDPRWNVTADGRVLRSLDAGLNWKTMSIDPKAQFVAIATVGASVWAGGKSGVLYHSIDAGERWTRVTPSDGPVTLTSDIAGINFEDFNHGTVRAGRDELWITYDGGKTWKRR